jgi:hypothetical protein
VRIIIVNIYSVLYLGGDCNNIHFIFSVKLEGQEQAHVEILANVVERNIQLFSMESKTQVQHIQFGPTYYGTDQLQSFVLCNNGPDRINFVVLLDEDSEGQEVVCRIISYYLHLPSYCTNQKYLCFLHRVWT